MKKLAVILVLFIYLFSSTEAYQLLKLPLLIEHYQKHKHEDAKISFIKFLHIHYLQGVKFDDDYAQDMQLPFKTHAEDFCFCSVISMPLQKFELPKVCFPVAIRNTFNNYSCNYSYLSLHDIFQPPRV